MTGTARRRSSKGLAAAFLALGATALILTIGLPSAGADTPQYTLPVSLPSHVSAPSFDAAAPYTPAVLSLIAQLEPSNPPTQAELANADRLLHDTPANTTNGWTARPTAFNPNNVSCHNVGPVLASTGTTPSVEDICWTDAQGVLNTSGPNARGSTAPMTLMGLAASFDRSLGNVWGQTEGAESRAFMVTGMFGPQTDLDRIPQWGRNLTTTGEDPYLSSQLVAAQINGIQGAGAMSEMKHFVVYNGQNQNANTDISDQGLHELYLTPYEGGFVDGRAAATMCSYQIWRDTSTNPALIDPISTLSTTSPLSPYAKPGENPQTWPLDESHFSCEQPLSLTHVLHDTWGSQALVGSDYPATHSTSSIMQGEDQEMPTSNGFLSANSTLTAGQQVDATGSTCADAAGNWVDCSTPGAAHVGGIPNGFQNSGGSGCANTYGCPLVDSVVTGNLPLSVFNQALARILYEEERFGMLGCEPTPTPTCTNPGGVGGDRTGAANLPTGGDGQLGTKYGDAAIVEKYSEEGATLLKNDDHALPITGADLAGGILVTGGNANHTVADPTNEASTGFIGRDSINPLQQLKDFSGNPNAFTFVPANDPDGQAVPTSVLSTDTSGSTFGGLNLSVNGGAPTQDTNPIDHTKVNGNRLASGTYTWSGYLYVPTADTYTFALQQSPSLPTTLNCPQTGQFGTPQAEPNQQPLTLCTAFTTANASQTSTPPDAVTFTLDGTRLNLNATTANVYGATVPSSPTNAGYTEQGLISRTCATGTAALEPGTTNCTAAQSSLSPGYHQIQITVDNATSCLATPPAAAAGTNPAVAAVPAPCGQASFRFAFSRVNGDIADAAAAAAGKSKAIVFVNTGSGTTNTAVSPPGTPYDGHTISSVIAMSAAQVNLITAVAAANPNTIVVINSDNPVDTSWIDSAKSVLEMWFAGQEGGTSTARILLGQANPGGHTALTWPVNRTDTIWGYNEPADGLYPGSTAGQHLDRLNGNAACAGAGNPGSLPCPLAGGTNESEGIYTGYRYFDKLGITPRFPFGFGLSYTTFAFSKLKVKQTDDGGADVSFTVKNTGSVSGADAVQVYVGPPSARPSGVRFAVRSLAQFDRVELGAGQSKDVELHVTARQLSYWSESAQQWVLDAGGRTIYVGDADALDHLPLQATLKAAKKNVTCSNQQFNATTIDGNLTVAKGDWCDLVQVKVNGNLHLEQTSGVRIAGVTIKGNLESERASGAADPMSSGANVICNSTIGGNLHVHGSAAGAPWHLGACGPNTVGGNVLFSDNAGTGNTIWGANIHGNLTCDKNADVGEGNNTVGGKREKQCAGL
jgi:beta-glucosidase